MVAGFLTFLVLVAIWGVFILTQLGSISGIKLDVVAALGMTGFLLFSVLGWVVLKRVKARAGAKQLDQTLQSQAEDQEKSARPDLQPAVQEMRAEFQKAVGSLKSSKLGRTGTDALSALPWYVIIGPPGAGKSTALRNCGLKFPALGKKGGVRGVGGTRNCDWWLTHEGILLDTAGRYVTEEDDQEEWLSFLDAVAKARPRRPINGLVVAVSAPELLGLDEQGAVALGQQLRERVDEVTGRLQVLAPVYLLVTKCDLLSGFVETFGTLPKSERRQVLGFTVPVGASHPDGAGQLVREKLDELTSVLEERSLTLLSQERRMSARERLFQFPRQLECLREVLGELAGALFSENPYQDTPLLRGTYFTSGTQEGRPIDKVMAAMAQAFGLPGTPGGGAEEAPVDARSYFLSDLFTDVLFKDAKLAVRSSKAVHHQQRLRYAYAAGGLALSALLVLLPLLSFLGMRTWTTRLLEDVKGVAGVSSLEDRITKLSVLRADLAALRRDEASTTRSVLGFGMDRRAPLIQAALPVYGFWVREWMVRPLVEQDEDALSRLPEPGSPPLPPGKLDEPLTYERLKRTLFLSLEPADPPATRPELFRAGLRSLVAPMAATFKHASAVSASREELERHLGLLFEVWPGFHALWRFERHEAVKRKAQAALAGMNRTKRLLDQQLRAWAGDQGALTLGSMVQDDSVFQTDRVIRAAFTKAVWKEHAREALESPPADDEAWVLGVRPVSNAQVQEALKREYYLQYVREWTQFLASIELRQLLDPNDVKRRLESLTDAQSPLRDIFKKVVENTMLAVPRTQGGVPDEHAVSASFLPLSGVIPALAGLGGLTDALKGKGTGRERVDLSMYEGRLKDLLKAVASASDPAAAASVAVSMRAATSDLASLISSQHQGDLYEDVLRQLWLHPLQKMANMMDAGPRQALNFRWCSAVYAPHKQELHGRYPFSRGGPDADLDALVELYNAKDGKLLSFYKENLATRVGSDGETFRRIGGDQVRDELLGYLTRARTLADAVFPNDSAEPSVEFAVQLHPPPLPSIVAATFTLDGQQIQQDTGPLEPAKAVRWPGEKSAPKGATLTLIRKGAPPVTVTCRGCQGAWGLFHLLEQGKVVRKGPRSVTMSWLANLGDRGVAEITADFTWSRSVSPFFGREGAHQGPLLGVFRDAEPPSAIVAGVEACR